MIRYTYNRQVEPPAPFIHVSLRCLETDKSVASLPALIDTAADRAVIPGAVAEVLGLIPLDELLVAGLGGQVFSALTYKVELAIRSLSPQKVVLIAHEEEPYILLGRDVLNRHRLLLDGPGLAFEIG
jgi:gag-polyprotein putative aspartyl protease